MIKTGEPKLELLSHAQLNDIHNATLELLQRTGIVFKHPTALKIFDEAGAYVDYKLQKVFIPAGLVEEALRKAPSSFTWCARNPKKNVRMEKGRIHFGPVSTPPFIYDLDTGQKREATYKDCENVTKLMDYLEKADDGYCAVHPLDVPDRAAHAYVMLAQILNTDKCVRGRGRGTAVARECLEMVSMVAGDEKTLMRRPMLIYNVNSSSPLQWDTTMIEGTIEYVKLKQPVIPSPEILAGAIGPVTLAGTMVQHNAEVLGMVTFMQLLNPGTPAMYGVVSSIMDMKTTMMRLGSPELGIMHVGFAQLARRYNLPMRGCAGNTDAKTLDAQAGYETAFNVVLSALAGVNLITYAFGAMEFTVSLCYEKILTDNEFLGMVERLLKGIAVSDETMALDVIDEVGPGGHFLAHKHTRQHHKTEHFIPKLFDTQSYESWTKTGSKTIRENAREEVRRILQEHPRPAIDKDLEKMLREYVKNIERKGNH